MSGLHRALAILLLAAIFGALADVRTPSGASGFHLYPIGLIAVAQYQVHGREQRIVSALALVSTAGMLYVLGLTPPASVLYAAASVLAGYLALRLLRSRDADVPLSSENDWARVVLASLFGALTLGAAAAIADAWDSTGSTGVLVLAGVVNGFASLLVWLPLAVRTPLSGALAGAGERAVQRMLLLASSALVFSASSLPPFVYVVFGLLCWSALRLSLVETLAQVLLVRLVATTFAAHDMGPYAPSAVAANLPPDLELLYVQLFLIACSVCVVALGLSSSRTRTETRLAATAHAQTVADAQMSTVVEELQAERTRVEEMREVDKVKDALVSTVSHELRTPITNIIGYSEMLEDGDYGDLSTDQGHVLTKIEDNSRRLLGLIDDLLTLSRMRSDEIELVCSPVDLVTVARHAEESILPRLAGAGLSLEVDLPADPVVVSADAEKVERVLVNLMSNAVKFTPVDGQIRLSLGTDDTWAVLEVSDTGYGIAPEDLDRLFSQFFRTSTAERRHIPGTGLGLSIVRSIVEAHGGHVDVSSVVDEGTTFRVRLPA